MLPRLAKAAAGLVRSEKPLIAVFSMRSGPLLATAKTGAEVFQPTDLLRVVRIDRVQLLPGHLPPPRQNRQRRDRQGGIAVVSFV